MSRCRPSDVVTSHRIVCCFAECALHGSCESPSAIESGTQSLAPKVFAWEGRMIRLGAKVLSFLMNDSSDSLTLICFVSTLNTRAMLFLSITGALAHSSSLHSPDSLSAFPLSATSVYINVNQLLRLIIGNEIAMPVISIEITGYLSDPCSCRKQHHEQFSYSVDHLDELQFSWT
jgi:hypothetical protein